MIHEVGERAFELFLLEFVVDFCVVDLVEQLKSSDIELAGWIDDIDIAIDEVLSVWSALDADYSFIGYSSENLEGEFVVIEYGTRFEDDC